MVPFNPQNCPEAYMEILKWGLIAIRDSAYNGKARLCEIEAEHLHNIPTLIWETNEKRHLCYLQQERSYYFGHLAELKDKDCLTIYTQSPVRFYQEPWQVLFDAHLPVQYKLEEKAAGDDTSIS